MNVIDSIGIHFNFNFSSIVLVNELNLINNNFSYFNFLETKKNIDAGGVVRTNDDKINLHFINIIIENEYYYSKETNSVFRIVPLENH